VSLDLTLHYGVDPNALAAELAARFVPMSRDAATERFIHLVESARLGRLAGAAHSFLRQFMSDFDVNGMLGAYPLFLLGPDQWRALLEGHTGGALLDVGAGSGDVTACYAPLFGGVTAVETSREMHKRLASRGYDARALDLSRDPVPGGPWPTIMLLNVLDRCARPRSLLAALRDALAPNGALVVSLPLPYRPHWYEGGRSLDPLEPLGIRAARFETAVGELAEELTRAGLRPRRWTRAPYLSGGDARRALYVLDAAVLLCTREDPA
jgi:SAM-dependent methyltransferase